MNRDARGRFGKGNTFSPGRPRGLGSKKLRDLIGPESEQAILDKLLELALGGDVSALKIFMDRLFPAPAAREAELEERLARLEEMLKPQAVA